MVSKLSRQAAYYKKVNIQMNATESRPLPQLLKAKSVFTRRQSLSQRLAVHYTRYVIETKGCMGKRDAIVAAS